MKVTATYHQSAEIERFLRRLTGPNMQRAGARGLNEHAEEQKRQSVTRIAAYTGVPKGRVHSKTRVKRAAPSANMAAEVITADKAIRLAEYGNPQWTRDLNPGWKGGAVSSMRGAEATAWNVRRQFPGTWVAQGQVWRRSDPGDNRSRPVPLFAAVLANELAKPSRPNVPAAERYLALDLEKRVTRHVLRELGT